jgi:hypothetical protein
VFSYEMKPDTPGLNTSGIWGHQTRKAVTMFTPVTPEGERIRAEAILRSFTDYEAAVELFVPHGPQDNTAELEPNRTNGLSRIFKAFKPDRRPVAAESVQQPAYAPRPVTTNGCS